MIEIYKLSIENVHRLDPLIYIYFIACSFCKEDTCTPYIKKNVQYFSKLIIMHLIPFIKKNEYDLHVLRADLIGYGNL